ncbi:MCE family protein [Amycolatopsis sp. K13G38]|uniref:MCE family protein n=1 Tax=Amycolatopsis acididurans TaxID=2724524 RepID=A0ABX1IYX4_9PSEU|nr:MlaD family protein [Amycolatopsis acididurans]NKQ52712.1 MCE family protein [Amycolatopsis acididurans]
MRRRIGVAALAFALCGCSFQDLPVGRAPEGDSYHLTVVFDDASNLPIGGKVHLGQAVVGRVSALQAKDFQARVTIAVRQDVKLPRGTHAELQVTSALGEEFIALTTPPGQGQDYLGDGGTIPVTDTSRGPSVEDLLAAVGTTLNGAGLEQARTVVAEANTALGGRTGEIRDLFGRLDRLLAGVDAHRGEITHTLDSLDTLAKTATSERATIEAGLTRITPALQVLIGERGDFETLLGRVTTLSTVTQDVLGKTEDEVLGLVHDMRPLLDQVAGMDRQLGDTLAKLAPFQDKIAKAVPGDYLNLVGTLDIPNTLLPVLTGQPPPPAGQPPQTLTDFLARGTR